MSEDVHKLACLVQCNYLDRQDTLYSSIVSHRSWYTIKRSKLLHASLCNLEIGYTESGLKGPQALSLSGLAGHFIEL